MVIFLLITVTAVLSAIPLFAFSSFTAVPSANSFGQFAFRHQNAIDPMEMHVKIPKAAKVAKRLSAANRAAAEAMIEDMMLKMLAAKGPGFLKNLPDFPDEEKTDLERAQDMVWQAQELNNTKKRLALARKAADLSPQCADALMMLAFEGKVSDDEKFALVQQAEKGGAEALGPKTFARDVGHFWGLIETRPYMRALMALAQLQWKRGNHNAALASYSKLLHLCPNDNLGARYEFLDRLIIKGELKEAAKLLKSYKDEASAFFDYGKVLLALARKDETAAGTFFREAQGRNSYVPAYLTGKTPMPKQMPFGYQPGHASEAVEYAKNGQAVWNAVPGALEWLRAKTE
jgi:tetratricopeptide (TPR) repeat protein